MSEKEETEIEVYTEMIGRVFNKVENFNNEELRFDEMRFFHEQYCCESVGIEEIIGDLSDLEGSPMLAAESVTQEQDTDWGHQTATFYKFITLKGSVTVRWLGESNGYYSEYVSFDNGKGEK